MPRRIPGTANKRVPGSRSAKLPAFNVGRFLTRVPTQDSASDWNALHRMQVRDVQGRFAGGIGFAWQGLNAMGDNIIAAVDANMSSVNAAVQQLANEMVEYARTNHPWQNRTGAAEEGLQAQVVRQSPDQWTIFLGHGSDVSYGLWLEVRWGGKYAIILPTLQYFAPRLGATSVTPGA